MARSRILRRYRRWRTRRYAAAPSAWSRTLPMVGILLIVLGAVMMAIYVMQLR